MKKEKVEIVLFASSFIVLNLIGYFFDIDILKTQIRREDGFTYYFVSLYISLLIVIIYNIMYRIVTKYNRK